MSYFIIMLEDILEYKQIIVIAVFIILLCLESIIPAYQLKKGKIEHDLFNLCFGGFNILISAFILVFAFKFTSDFIVDKQLGLSFLLSDWPVLSLILTLVCFDCAMYIWHRLNHKIPFLW